MNSTNELKKLVSSPYDDDSYIPSEQTRYCERKLQRPSVFISVLLPHIIYKLILRSLRARRRTTTKTVATIILYYSLSLEFRKVLPALQPLKTNLGNMALIRSMSSVNRLRKKSINFTASQWFSSQEPLRFLPFLLYHRWRSMEPDDRLFREPFHRRVRVVYYFLHFYEFLDCGGTVAGTL